jgi:hypothetical protein
MSVNFFIFFGYFILSKYQKEIILHKIIAKR